MNVAVIFVLVIAVFICGCSGPMDAPTEKPMCLKQSRKGTGNDLLHFAKHHDGCKTITFTSRGKSNFIVWTMEEIDNVYVEDRLLANEVGVKAWSERWIPGTRIIQIETLGAWELSIQ